MNRDNAPHKPVEGKGSSPESKETIMFVVMNNVEGSVYDVCLYKMEKEAVECAVELAADQCDATDQEIRDQLNEDSTFVSPNGDIIVSIHKASLPSD